MTIDRRKLLFSGTLLAGVALTPSSIWAAIKDGETGQASDSQRLLLAIVCDLLIPETDTAAASKAGVPDFVELGLRHGLEGPPDPHTQAKGGLLLIDRLADALNQAVHGDFTHVAAPAQLQALAQIDRAAFAAGGETLPWRKIKALILTGYYTSEVGASQELQYELVPGRFDPDLPLGPADRAWSSDWTAVQFG